VKWGAGGNGRKKANSYLLVNCKRTSKG